jgi:hypothetical protein
MNIDKVIRKVLLEIKNDRRKKVNENKTLLSEEQCKNSWWWEKENKQSDGSQCWSGKDLMSCSLRKTLVLNGLRIAFCGGINYAIPCGDDVWGSNACVLGRSGDEFSNPYVKNTSFKRRELFVVQPISEDKSNILVEVFRERKELIKSLDNLLGESKKSAMHATICSGKDMEGLETSYYDVLGGYREGNACGAFFWVAKNVSDSTVNSILNLIKNKTSIPFERDVRTGESSWTYVADEDEDENDVIDNEEKPSTPTVSQTIKDTTNPETGKKYVFKDVQTEFGVKPYNNSESKDSTNNKENFNDNLKLQKAWKEGWRPGKEVPEKHQTTTYKGKSNSQESNDKNKNQDKLNVIVIDDI